MSHVRLSVTSFSSQTSGAIALKISMHIPHIDGSKDMVQIFDILLRSPDIEVQSFIFMSLIDHIILKLEKSLMNNIFSLINFYLALKKLTEP